MIPYTYIFLRKDLKPVYHIIQAGHAIQEAALAFGRPTGEIPIHFTLFEVKGIVHLLKTAEFLESFGIKYKMFHEPDFDTGYTAIATEPLAGMQHLFKKYKLFICDK